MTTKEDVRRKAQGMAEEGLASDPMLETIADILIEIRDRIGEPIAATLEERVESSATEVLRDRVEELQERLDHANARIKLLSPWKERGLRAVKVVKAALPHIAGRSADADDLRNLAKQMEGWA